MVAAGQLSITELLFDVQKDGLMQKYTWPERLVDAVSIVDFVIGTVVDERPQIEPMVGRQLIVGAEYSGQTCLADRMEVVETIAPSGFQLLGIGIVHRELVRPARVIVL